VGENREPTPHGITPLEQLQNQLWRDRLMADLSLKVTLQGQLALGKILAEFRSSRNMSLRSASEYIAEKTGENPVSFTTLGAIERGSVKPDLSTLLLFAQSGYGQMTFSQMVNVLTGGNLSALEEIRAEVPPSFCLSDAVVHLKDLPDEEKIRLSILLLSSLTNGGIA
jgi:transcriptional regulator with XRE-family HTH domain